MILLYRLIICHELRKSDFTHALTITYQIEWFIISDVNFQYIIPFYIVHSMYLQYADAE